VLRNPIALILGAGASKPYGYPLGGDLRTTIVNLQPELRDLVASAGFDKKAIVQFSEEFGASNLTSIDVFLERRQNFADLGRAIIAAAILQKDAYVIRGDWYEYLWQQMTRGVPSIDQFSKNRLSVITFNYDTSFERYMINSIRAAYDVPLANAIDAFKAVQIVHVHGSIPYAQEGGALRMSLLRLRATSGQL
jgi:hypothetical protein